VGVPQHLWRIWRCNPAPDFLKPAPEPGRFQNIPDLMARPCMRVHDTSTKPPQIYVRKARGMGRGVFAARPFRKGEVIEVCPVVPIPTEVTRGPRGREFDCYVYKWGKDGDELAIALGYGLLYNHSPRPNARFTRRRSRGEIVFRATRAIAAGEQILIDYQWDEADYCGFRLTQRSAG
jgi:SET domain-containing protein